MTNYGDLDFWEARYANSQGMSFDWLEDPESLKHIFDDYVTQQSKILNVGCGNSELAQFLLKNYSPKTVINIDFSKTVIEFMKEKNSHMGEQVLWEVMDAKDLLYQQNYFDLVVDKATLDTVLCTERSQVNAAVMLNEVQRVLKTGGNYLLLSHSGPESRLPHLERQHLHFEIIFREIRKTYDSQEDEQLNDLLNSDSGLISLVKEKVNHLYICKKKSGADTISQDNFAKVIYDLDHNELVQSQETVREW